MDKLIINGVELFGYHGVNEEEKRLGQKFIIDVVLTLDLREAAHTDNLEKTINYAKLCDEIEEEFTRVTYDLIEKAAHELAHFILLRYHQVLSVTLTLKKPWAPVKRVLNYPAIEVTRSWHEVFIALGSNMGDKVFNIEQAIALINAAKHSGVLQVSKFIETDPIGYLEQDKFLNGVARIKTLLPPKELMHFLLRIEQDLKRERTIKNGPRTIDLDIIFYDDVVTCSEEVIIPHPRMQDRLFVLAPLNEIASCKVHPLLHRRVSDILADLKLKEQSNY